VPARRASAQRPHRARAKKKLDSSSGRLTNVDTTLAAGGRLGIRF